MEKAHFPAGYYECPKCNDGLVVYVPLVEAPTHRCGVGRKLYTMVYKGEKRAKTRGSVRRLGESTEDAG